MYEKDKIISHYRIIEKLGAGGMGDVYKAEDLNLKRIVALKFLPPDVTRSEKAKHRFMHEAQTASSLDHPNICTIHEFGESDEGELFIAMSCYEGKSLRKIIEENDLSLQKAIDVAIQLAEGLAVAHEKGIVHRDVKPENVIVTSTGVLKILDFGLSMLAGQSRLTVEGTTLGTAAYMSPEQAQAAPTDHRSDIFSLCGIIYELITGTHPFHAEHQLAIMYSIINESPPSIRDLNPEIPEKLETIILRGMEKNPDDRYADLKEMVKDLKSFSTGNESEEKTEQRGEAKRETKSAYDRGSISRLVNFIVTRKMRVMLVFILFVLLVFVAVIIDRVVIDNDQNHQLAKRYVEQAIIDINEQKLPAAKFKLDAAIEIDPSYSDAWSHLAAVNLNLGELDNAIRYGQKAIELDPMNTNAYYNLAYAFEDKTEFNKAIEYYRIAIEKDSFFVQAYSALGNLYIKTEQPESALQVLELAELKAPTSNYIFLIYKNRGKAYYKLKNYDQAIFFLQQSLKIQPFDVPETVYYLGMSYAKEGRIEESVESLQRYAEIADDPTKKQEVQKLLGEILKK